MTVDCQHGIALNLHCQECVDEEASSWKHRPWFVFDLETTGVDVDESRIVQVGGLWMQNGELQDRRLVTVNPGVEIPEEAARVHGVTNERVANAPTFRDVFPAVLAHFQRAQVVVTYNGSRFDWPLFVAEVKRLDYADDPARIDHGDGLGSREFKLWGAVAETLFVDVLVQVKRKSVGRWWKGRGRHRLENVANRMDIRLPPGMRPHRADADCYVAGRILWETRHKLPNTDQEVRELLEDRAREQEEDYRRWKESQRQHEEAHDRAQYSGGYDGSGS